MRKNREEMMFAEVFRKKGFDVKPEPFTNKTPDIVLNDIIAVEVTRLCKVTYIQGIKSNGSDSVSIIEKLKKAINSSGHRIGYRYSVTAIIKRPFNKSKETLKNITKKLSEIENTGFFEGDRICHISDFVTIKISERHGVEQQGFLLTSIIDLDAAGGDYEVVHKSILDCMKSKAHKIEKEKNRNEEINKYQEWWLALSDTITYDSMSEYKARLKNDLPNLLFSKIIFINSLNGAITTEICFK